MRSSSSLRRMFTVAAVLVASLMGTNALALSTCYWGGVAGGNYVEGTIIATSYSGRWICTSSGTWSPYLHATTPKLPLLVVITDGKGTVKPPVTTATTATK